MLSLCLGSKKEKTYNGYLTDFMSFKYNVDVYAKNSEVGYGLLQNGRPNKDTIVNIAG